tara:strand:+ start:278 stop:526 length:249 start_codon:yes stop_codon:yes gene_type:complete
VKDKPNTTLAMITNIRQVILVLQGINKKNIPENIQKVLNSLNRCQASVNPTRRLLDKKNFSPAKGSPFLYLFLQDSLGSQNS